MAELTVRRKSLGIVGGTALATAVAIYLFNFNVFGPSPYQGRAALADAGLSLPDAPISAREGKTVIGECECDLRGAGSSFNYRCLGPNGSAGRLSRSRLGRWQAVPIPQNTEPAIE